MPSIFESRSMHPGLDSELDAIYAGMDQQQPTPEAQSSGLGAAVINHLAQASSDTHLSAEAKELRDRLIEPQLANATEAFNQVSDALGLDSPMLAQPTIEVLRSELNEWLTDDKLGYVRQQMEIDQRAEQAHDQEQLEMQRNDPNHTLEVYKKLEFNLVATPNILLDSHDQLFGAAKAFGKDGPNSPQPHVTWIFDHDYSGADKKLYKAYTLDQLSGTNPGDGNQAMFSLIPNKAHPQLVNKTAQQQRATFNQDIQPAMHDHKVPSVLESVAYWYTLRQQLPPNTPLKDYDSTLIRHFDLEDVLVDGDVLVPASVVDGVGKPGLDNSDAGLALDWRVSVG